MGRQLHYVLYYLIGIVVSGVSFGYEPDLAQSNMASEFATCSAYYSLMAHALERQGEDSERMRGLGYITHELAVGLSNDKVTKARIEIDTKSMMSEISNNWSNGAILINKYGLHCKDIIEKPEERMQYWLDK